MAALEATKSSVSELAMSTVASAAVAAQESGHVEPCQHLEPTTDDLDLHHLPLHRNN
jgi:hypothetical protein